MYQASHVIYTIITISTVSVSAARTRRGQIEELS